MYRVIGLAGYLVIGSVIGLSAIGSGNLVIGSGIGKSGIVAAGTDVSGVVRDARGRAIVSARVSLMRVDDVPPATPGGKPTKTLVELDTMRTNARGAFKFAGVSNGRYQLLVARDLNWLMADGLVITGTPIQPIALVLDGKTRLVTLSVKRLPAA